MALVLHFCCLSLTKRLISARKCYTSVHESTGGLMALLSQYMPFLWTYSLSQALIYVLHTIEWINTKCCKMREVITINKTLILPLNQITPVFWKGCRCCRSHWESKPHDAVLCSFQPLFSSSVNNIYIQLWEAALSSGVGCTQHAQCEVEENMWQVKKVKHLGSQTDPYIFLRSWTSKPRMETELMLLLTCNNNNIKLYLYSIVFAKLQSDLLGKEKPGWGKGKVW